MHDQKKCSISQLHDGYLAHDQVGDVADQLTSCREDRLRLERYSIIGDCMRGQDPWISPRFADGLMDRLEREQQEAGEGVSVLPQRTGSRRGFGKRISGLAATFVLGALATMLLSPSSPLPPSAPSPAVASWPADREAAATLDALVQVHGQVSFGRYQGTGFLPYAPALVTPPPAEGAE